MGAGARGEAPDGRRAVPVGTRWAPDGRRGRGASRSPTYSTEAMGRSWSMAQRATVARLRERR